MRSHPFRVAPILLLLAAPLAAADLSQIDRNIKRLPAFTTDSQDYGLLVFGPEAAKHVWLVRDGGILYVDRNANGDLTEPDERVVADPQSQPEAGTFLFRAGDIPDEPRSHRNLMVGWHKLTQAQLSDPATAPKLDRGPEMPCCDLMIDASIAGAHGEGLEGRVLQVLWDDGRLQFAARPEDAPIVHLAGPWQLVGGGGGFPVGGSRELYLAVGTLGLGAGTTACVGYAGAVPATVNPKLTVTFPSGEGQPAMTKSYELKRRCCGINLYDDVHIPPDVGTGMAKIEVTLESWPGGFVAPLVRNMRIVPAKPGPKLEPVSDRLVNRLRHRDPRAAVAGIHFSPDGKRLLAGSDADGVYHVWDVANGQQLVTIEAGGLYLPSNHYFTISADWQTLFVPFEGKENRERVERDGKILTRSTYDGSLRTWDLNTGAPKQSAGDQPPSGLIALWPAPDRMRFLTLEYTPGENEANRSRTLSLWDSVTLTHRRVGDGSEIPSEFAPDGKSLALSVSDADSNQRSTIRLVSFPEWTEQHVFSLGHGLSSFDSAVFAENGRTLVTASRTYEKPNQYDLAKSYLKFWRIGTGEEILSIEPFGNEETFSFATVSPDGQTVVAITTSFSGRRSGRIYFVDLATRTWKMVDPEPGASTRKPTFHPNGNWLVVPTQLIPADFRPGPNPAIEMFEQPRLVLLDKSGNVLETMISPQSYASSTVFSPDGKTLATSGDGQVLLWDMHDVADKASPANR